MKSDLREVLYSHKWTPDAYLLAKAYVADDGVPVETDILPKLQMRSTTRKLYVKTTLTHILTQSAYGK